MVCRVSTSQESDAVTNEHQETTCTGVGMSGAGRRPRCWRRQLGDEATAQPQPLQTPALTCRICTRQVWVVVFICVCVCVVERVCVKKSVKRQFNLLADRYCCSTAMWTMCSTQSVIVKHVSVLSTTQIPLLNSYNCFDIAVWVSSITNAF